MLKWLPVAGSLLVLLAAVVRVEQSHAVESYRRVSHARNKMPRSYETTNFQIVSNGGKPLAQATLDQIEQQRLAVYRDWLADEATPAWQPKCMLVLHATRGSYLAVAGPGAGQTVACSWLDTQGATVLCRRIDVLAIHGDWIDHVPHELTHLALQARFAGRELPVWADEGIAMTADPADKRAAHCCDLEQALRSGKLFSAAELVTMTDYPAADRLGAFYAQSLSLVEHLLGRGGRALLIAFLNAADAQGYDAALRDMYQIDGLAALNQLWSVDLPAATAR